MNIHQEHPPAIGIALLKIALLYLLLGLLLGIGMAASHHFELRPVHTHLNLLGWTTLAISGLLYCHFPRAAGSRLAKGHFWLHNLGLPLMMAGLTAYSLGVNPAEPLIALGSLLVTLGLILFSVTIFRSFSVRTVADEAREKLSRVAVTE